MLSFEKFSGINNVLPQSRMDDSALVSALDVDIGLTGEISRRGGYSQTSLMCHKNLHQSPLYLLATVESDLTAIYPNGDRLVVSESLGMDRVWYCDLPDGRTTFSNGLIHGITDGLTSKPWSVPVPESTGALSPSVGSLHAGQYAYYLTYVRADGLEGAAAFAAPVQVDSGGVYITGLPVMDGYTINVYLSGHNGEGAYFAGTTATGEFLFGGKNETLVLPCRTLGYSPAPIGTVTAFWRGRVLVAQGSTLWASLPHAPHLFDLRRDFKQMVGAITLIQPVDDGVYVGTDKDLYFLAGTQWDQLVLSAKNLGPVALGSGVTASGSDIKLGQGMGSDTAMLCIADGYVVAGFSSGQAYAMTNNVYRTTATEFCATFREVDGITQYMAVPQ